MNNSNMPAMPQSGFGMASDDSYVSEDCGGVGLTKREYFAAMAIQGAACNTVFTASEIDIKQAAMSSVMMADALLAELEKEQ